MRRWLLPLWLVLGVAAAGCGGDGEKSAATTTVVTTTTETATATTTATGTATNTTTETPPVTTHGRFHYPKVIVDNFMRSCTNGQQKRVAYCGCTLDKLSNDVSVQDFARIGLSGGKLSPRMNRLIRRAAVACADKL